MQQHGYCCSQGANSINRSETGTMFENVSICRLDIKINTATQAACVLQSCEQLLCSELQLAEHGSASILPHCHQLPYTQDKVPESMHTEDST